MSKTHVNNCRYDSVSELHLIEFFSSVDCEPRYIAIIIQKLFEIQAIIYQM